MEIYYIDIEEIKKLYDKNFLAQYCDKNIKFDKRFYEYSIGRYLVKKVAKTYYNVVDTEIITIANGKPVFKNSKVHFSITHSKNIVMACFDQNPCGIDIEYIKNRNLEKLSKHYMCEFNDTEEFYRFWTQKEALYKADSHAENIYFSKILNDFYMTVVYNGEKKNVIKINKIM